MRENPAAGQPEDPDYWRRKSPHEFAGQPEDPEAWEEQEEDSSPNVPPAMD
ncbi:hypothetical protein [Gordonia rhizosphera]|uniref:Uncharacterized protein n=1 Tax=Gordonia rhizosphera NBRC 16068 TaxID=1108045 RepID=K6W3N9_9ACTN|nr:hypothetical protein [Gordonia rhizosphera]GAB93775.1 hypothetical protein GORHZ_245_00130 [Gordonia rhizosphera NBRC 16068]